MTDHQHGPPKNVEGLTPHHRGQPSTNMISSLETANADHGTPVGRQSRYHKPSTGLRASGFREGYTACLCWIQREFDQHLDEIGRTRLAAILARSEAA